MPHRAAIMRASPIVAPANSVSTATVPAASPRRPPGPRPRFPGQFLLAMRRDILGFLDRLARDYPDIARIDLGRQPIIVARHPDYVRDVLVTSQRMFGRGLGHERLKPLLGEGLLTSDGDFHLRQRRLAQPAFHRQRIAGYADIMVRATCEARDGWRDGAALDVHDAMMRLTLEIAAATLFGADLREEARAIGGALTTAMELFTIAMYPGGLLLEKLPLPISFRYRRARDLLETTIYRIIAERRRDGRDHGDLLSMLIEATDAEGDGGRMTDEHLRDEAMTLLMAGHETTANALTWTWYLLSQHREVEARLHTEIDDVLGDRAPTIEDVPRLPYARMVLSESMRLYPPAYAMGRRARAEHAIDGWRIPAGALVLVSQWLTHRDARWWPEPERFLPERFASEAGDRPRFAYFPFGAGSRQCIGESFAWTEGVLVLATIAQRWRFRLQPAFRPGLNPLVTLRPKGGMPMRAERRRDPANADPAARQASPDAADSGRRRTMPAR